MLFHFIPLSLLFWSLSIIVGAFCDKIWDNEKKYFVTGGEVERKVERKSKVKITVNDKVFYV